MQQTVSFMDTAAKI